MYAKKIYGREPLYFRYAPPLSALDDYSDDDLPKAPFKGAARHQRSVYYFWWLFLRENEGYWACCERGGTGEFSNLYADFGDVRPDDFVDWWIERGRALFSEPQASHIQAFPSDGVSLHDEDRLVVSIPVTGDLNRTLAELKKLLEPLQEEAIARSPQRQRPKYEVASKPVLSSLYQHYQVWRARKEHPEMTLLQIASLVGIQAGADDGSGKDPDQVKSISASRYLKQAAFLIECVGKGIFPILTPKQLEKLSSSV